MMTARTNRRGSALLIVIGMLSFMIISGLAFSYYMRSTRMPASFVRRTVLTRELVKAALAEAVDAIDQAVKDDPHPNVRMNANSDNWWLGRVLVGDQTSCNNMFSSLGSVVDGSETAQVLSLEALAYLPAPLVNEARYYGRLTPTAKWHTFDFDAGRYAFLAVDVSDYFDVNRVLADEARSSHPARRVNIAHIFEDGDEHSSAPSGAKAWEDQFMGLVRSIDDDGRISFDTKPPFVSIADFNLALGSGVGGLKSPFYQYVTSDGTGDGFYDAEFGDANWETYSRMTFVTDSLEAPVGDAEKKTANGDLVFDLDDEDKQPFEESFLDGQQRGRTLNTIWHKNTEAFSRLMKRGVPYVGMFALSDYLDCDRIPITLGMPSVERVPMICGIKPELGTSAIKISVTDLSGQSDTVVAGTEGTTATITKKRTVHWRVDATSLRDCVTGGNGVKALVVYPFRNLNNDSGEEPAFTVDGKIQVFLSSEKMRLRTGNQDDLLHWGAGDSGDARSPGSAKFVKNAVFNFPLNSQALTLTRPDLGFQDDIKSAEKDYVYSVELDMARSECASLVMSELADEKGDLLRVTYQWTLTGTQKQDGSGYENYQPTYADSLPTVGSGVGEARVLTDGDNKPSGSWQPLKPDGTLVDSQFYDDVATSPGTDLKFFLNAAVTLRVISSDPKVLGSSSGTKTVDMVPATIYDDEPLNDIGNSVGRLNEISGEATPLMKFETGVEPVINPQTTSRDLSLSLSLSPAAAMVDDPRWNHAPENWKTLADFTEKGWLDAITAHDRDGDIFMATSDQDYLQSIYELAFLPRFSNLATSDDDLRGNLSGYPDSDSSWTSLCEKEPIDRDLMWKTYDIFGRYSDEGDDFEGLGFENRGRGFRVNPYSDSTNVIMAAFANTPHDWRAASENADENPGASTQTDVAKFNAKYAWNGYSSGAKIDWLDLESVAGRFMGRVQSLASSGGIWEDALADIFDDTRSKDEAPRYLCGLKLDDSGDALYSVDKKFLYGFWRNSFAARQQLFLVFVRAEPMMLGGGVAGVTPPQLGAKGVAVVWRNPNSVSSNTSKSNNNNSDYIPHQTRILFYRQFE